MNKPLISIIIPTYNRANFIFETINSVLSQTYKNFELLICDDGSTDNTEEIIKQLNDPRIIYLKQENKGPGSARNLGIKNSKGEFIAFLDSDDLWLPEHLEILIQFFNIYPEAGLAYTQIEVIDKNNQKEKPSINYKKLEIPYEEKQEGFRLYKNLVFDYYLDGHILNSTSCSMIKKEVFDEIGLFNEDIYNGQDYELWLRITNKFKIGVARKPTVKYIVHNESISKSVSTKKHLENRLKIFESVKKECQLNESQKNKVEEIINQTKEKLSNL